MALAILELVDSDDARVKLRIDTGTNRYYHLKIGKGVTRRHGIDWVDGVVGSTAMRTNDAGGSLLGSGKEISIPAKAFEGGNAYVQLFSYKTPEGKAPAFSEVIRAGMSYKFPFQNTANRELSLSRPTSSATVTNMNNSFQTARSIRCQTYGDKYSQQASLEDVLGTIVKFVGPVVAKLITSKPDGQVANSAGNAAGAVGTGDMLKGGIDTLATLLKEILGSIQVGKETAAAKSLSVFTQPAASNRFFDAPGSQFARPFIFGIDDALLGAAIGQVVQILPQLMNGANQQRLQMRQENNKLVTDVLNTVNARILQERLLDAQHQAAKDSQTAKAAELEQLIKLLEVQGETGLTAANLPAIAKTQSLDSGSSSVLSNKAVLSFMTADPVPWNGKPSILFVKGQPVQLKIQFTVAEPVPPKPLPKAILKVTFKDPSSQSVMFEKSFKKKDVSPNAILKFSFTEGELSHLPVNKPVVVLAEIRWLRSKDKKEITALGSSEITLVSKYFLKEQGQTLDVEKELTDMNRFRPFWNKIWEAPSLDKASQNGGRKKYLWELDANAMYSVLLSPDHEANGLMNTKVLQGSKDEDSLSEKTEGRMKGGIELSVAELNKLIPLWNGDAVLDAEKLEAFKTESFAKNNAREFVYRLKLKGKAADRGMVWVIPIFKLTEFTLGSALKTNEDGQVMEVSEEKVRFPLPLSARVIGLKSS
jgi:hypothetical protein